MQDQVPPRNKMGGLTAKIPVSPSRHAALKSDYEQITQQMYAKNLELAQINRTLTILRAIDVIILSSRDTFGELSVSIARAILDSSSYEMIALMSLAHHADESIRLQGWALAGSKGDDPMYMRISDSLRSLKIPLSSSWMMTGERNMIINLDELDENNSPDFLDNAATQALFQMRDHLDIHSLYLTKLKTRGATLGVMMFGLRDNYPKIDDIELIERLGEPVGVALDNKLLFEENKLVLDRLRAANEKMRKMDETKDEFISMASHQLRTPLTSVKGYLSMVLEGDVGDITEQQRKLLDQAYISSQRMVFLIADLLNLSRLRTGKFIIDAMPTNLADVIQSEVGQLVETAKGRGLELTYIKPDNFPTLMLDETKIRQVIMNFIDNAIYYTPQGGHIRVELNQTEQSIEFRVVDDGIGVPKDAQAELFTKFYRAGNARKARPDGTGLGLFMAKKVIVAQGGAIIFKSDEGKGSTFGFTFAKAKIAVPSQPATPAA